MLNKLRKDKKGIFGLNAVQSFFTVILGVALLAYIIVIIMGVLGGTTIIPQSTTYVQNEVGAINNSGYTLTKASVSGFGNPSISSAVNTSSGTAIAAGNFTVSATGVITNASAQLWNATFNYSYSANTVHQNNLNSVLLNTSSGVSGFFSSINPIYAILAVLVIILVLVVLVRVVQTRESSVQM